MPPAEEISLPLPFQLSLDALSAACEDLRSAEEHVTEVRRLRNARIRDARSAGLTYVALSRATGLTREQLSTIVNSA